MRYVVNLGENRNRSRVLVGKPERKRPLGRPRNRQEDSIKKDSKQREWEWKAFSSDSGQEQVADSCVCGNELLGSVICDEYLD